MPALHIQTARPIDPARSAHWVSRLREVVRSAPDPIVAPQTATDGTAERAQLVEARQPCRYAVCVAGEMRLAIPLDHVLEIRPVPRCTPVPGTASFVRGITQLRNEALCAMELAGMLGASLPGADFAASERLLLVQAENGGQPAGLIVDAVLDLALLANPERASPAAGPMGEFLIESCLFGKESVRVLNVERLLGSGRVRQLAIANSR